MKNQYLIVFALWSILLLRCSDTKEGSNNPKEDRPNIVMILCDDLGYADVGFNGAKDIKTPQLDRLANSGMIFKAAYVAHPFCGPSRAALMTGRYPHTIHSQYNLPRKNDADGKGIATSEPFISSVLQSAGYHTGIVGKWHLGVVDQFHPNNRGFDDFYGFLGGGHKYFPEEFLAKYDRQKLEGATEIWDYLLPLEHNGTIVRDSIYLTDALSQVAVRFVENAEKKAQPFFLYLAYNAPHVPLEAKEEDMALYDHIADIDRRTYAAMMHAVDRGVGQVVEALKRTGAYDNTLIIFFSDNGGKLGIGAANNFPLRDGKGSACEGGYRVPMFFHWPAAIQQAQTVEHSITAIDLYPTLAGLADAVIPKDKILDGHNVWPQLMQGENPHEGDLIYVLRHRVGYSDVGVRRDEWKALKLDQEPWQLINIVEDVGEQNDLSSEYPEILKELVSSAEKWSETHVEPQWFHDEPTGVEWDEFDMPQYEETFRLD